MANAKDQDGDLTTVMESLHRLERQLERALKYSVTYGFILLALNVLALLLVGLSALGNWNAASFSASWKSIVLVTVLVGEGLVALTILVGAIRRE